MAQVSRESRDLKGFSMSMEVQKSRETDLAKARARDCSGFSYRGDHADISYNKQRRNVA